MTTRIAVKWGVILGVAICIWTLLIHSLGWYTTNLANGQAADQVAVVLPVAAIYFAIREHARRLGRAPALTEALGTGVLTGAVSIPFSVGFLWIYHHFINPRWNDVLVAYERTRMTEAGASAEDIARRVERLNATATDSAQIIGGILGTLVITVMISLIVFTIFRLTMRARGAPSRP